MIRRILQLGVCGVLLFGSSGWLGAQGLVIDQRPHILPHPPRPTPIHADYRIRVVEVQVGVWDQVAQVQVSQIFSNSSSQPLEASVFFPVPDEASISGLTLMVDGKELPGKLMKKGEARRIYEEIVMSRRDPALLEYVGQGLYQTSVFPIPPQGERKVEIRYTQLLRRENGLADLLVPLGTNKHSSKPVESLDLTVRVESQEAIKTVFSPTHKLTLERPDEKHAVGKLHLTNVQAPDDFRLMFGSQEGQVGLNLITYRPSEKEEGYFLLLAAPKLEGPDAAPVGKTILLILDRSGSMSGKKITQAKEAVKFVLRQLHPEDTFNLVAYDTAVESFRPELQKAAAESIQAAIGYTEGIHAGGGTNIDGALQTGLKMLSDSSRPTYVFFLTDGLPTSGELHELEINKNAKQANSVAARLFCFGVGFDVNSRLLDRLSHEQRGQSIYVRPNEDIESHVSALYAKVGTPVLTDVAVDVEFDAKPMPSAPPALSRAYPRQLPDLFQRDQLIWVGRYSTNGVAKITLTGSTGGEKRTFEFPGTFVEKSTDETNGFVEKLWATRRVGEIIDELDLKGQNQELIDELVQLSIKHGIMTPYTSFLADERTNLAAGKENGERAAGAAKSLATTNGQAGFAQRHYKARLQTESLPAATSNLSVRTLSVTPAQAGRGTSAANDGIQEAEVAGVRQVGQKTFFRRNKQWQDSSVTAEQQAQAISIVQFTPEYFKLASSHGGQLAKYVAFDEPVLLNLSGKTYRIEPPRN